MEIPGGGGSNVKSPGTENSGGLGGWSNWKKPSVGWGDFLEPRNQI